MIKINNPFESGHIKNYLLLYASVVVIMILFFIASTLFNDIEKVDKKVFSTEVSQEVKDERMKIKEEKAKEPTLKSKLKLIDRSY